MFLHNDIEHCETCDAIITDDPFNENKRKFCSGCGEEGCQKCMIVQDNGTYICRDENNPKLENMECLMAICEKSSKQAFEALDRLCKQVHNFINNIPAEN